MDDLSIPLLAISGAVFLLLVYGYVQLMVDRSRGVIMRLFFVGGQFVMLGFIALINFRVDAAIQVRSHGQLCSDRLERLATLVQKARVLRRGSYPESLDQLIQVPEYSAEDLRCPDTDRPYEFLHPESSAGGRSVCLIHDAVPHRSRSRWLRLPGARHVIRVTPNGRRIQWVDEREFERHLERLRTGPTVSGQ